MSITIERTQNDKLTKLTLGDVTIWFSYETAVAYEIPGTEGVIVSDKGWSVSTRRHLGTIANRRPPIPHAQFEAGLEALTPQSSRIAELDARAEAMYNAESSWMEFAQVFSLAELEQLADLCTMRLVDGNLTGGRSYDDEVFDALALVKGE